MEQADDILTAIQNRRSELEQDVVDKRKALSEAEARLATFRASAMSALGGTLETKSAQRQLAERQAVVAQLLGEGFTQIEIVRRTGLPSHLVNYDISRIRRREREAERNASGDALTEEPIVEMVADAEGDAASDPPAASPESPAPPSDEDEQESGGEAEQDPTDLNSDDKDDDDVGATLKELKAEGEKRAKLTRGVVLFYTTTDEGHRHVAELSRDGYGRTREVDGHSHAVNLYDVREFENHGHGLTLEPVSAGTAPAKPAAYAPPPGAAPGKPGVVRPGCAAGRDQLKAAMKDFRHGKRKSRTFRTTRDNDHEHVAMLDNMGDGETVKNDGTDHFHRVCRYELIEGSHDHTHGLTLEEANGEKKQ